MILISEKFMILRTKNFTLRTKKLLNHNLMHQTHNLNKKNGGVNSFLVTV